MRRVGRNESHISLMQARPRILKNDRRVQSERKLRRVMPMQSGREARPQHQHTLWPNVDLEGPLRHSSQFIQAKTLMHIYPRSGGACATAHEARQIEVHGARRICCLGSSRRDGNRRQAKYALGSCTPMWRMRTRSAHRPYRLEGHHGWGHYLSAM